MLEGGDISIVYLASAGASAAEISLESVMGIAFRSGFHYKNIVVGFGLFSNQIRAKAASIPVNNPAEPVGHSMEAVFVVVFHGADLIDSRLQPLSFVPVF